jgi:hypothetical protein
MNIDLSHLRKYLLIVLGHSELKNMSSGIVFGISFTFVIVFSTFGGRGGISGFPS